MATLTELFCISGHPSWELLNSGNGYFPLTSFSIQYSLITLSFKVAQFELRI